MNELELRNTAVLIHAAVRTDDNATHSKQGVVRNNKRHYTIPFCMVTEKTRVNDDWK